MVNTDDIYGASSYLKAQDLPPKPVEFTIEAIEERAFGPNNSNPKIILKLKGEKKSFIINKTNAGIIASALGKETDNWIDKKITLVKTLITLSSGESVLSIRVQKAEKLEKGI